MLGDQIALLGISRAFEVDISVLRADGGKYSWAGDGLGYSRQVELFLSGLHHEKLYRKEGPVSGQRSVARHVI